ncbi:hypothetical protein KP509_1Z223500 [Ceratopteris richardii]|nr:hypothetical protein KP509_1Z223500 [Ceratopteris richardii]
MFSKFCIALSLSHSLSFSLTHTHKLCSVLTTVELLRFLEILIASNIATESTISLHPISAMDSEARYSRSLSSANCLTIMAIMAKEDFRRTLLLAAKNQDAVLQKERYTFIQRLSLQMIISYCSFAINAAQ